MWFVLWHVHFLHYFVERTRLFVLVFDFIVTRYLFLFVSSFTVSCVTSVGEGPESAVATLTTGVAESPKQPLLPTDSAGVSLVSVPLHRLIVSSFYSSSYDIFPSDASSLVRRCSAGCFWRGLEPPT